MSFTSDVTAVVEPVIVDEIFITGIAELECLGDVVRCVCTVERRSGAHVERVVRLRTVIPVSVWPEMIRQCAALPLAALTH